jgi:hypothetical protein
MRTHDGLFIDRLGINNELGLKKYSFLDQDSRRGLDLNFGSIPTWSNEECRGRVLL